MAAIGEIVRFNPAALPALHTPVGAELNVHSYKEGPEGSHTDFTLIKGFSHLGLALESWTVDTIAGPDLESLFSGLPQKAAYQTYENAKSTSQGYRAGAALALPFLNGKLVQARIGGTVGQDQKSSPASQGLGAIVDVGHLNFGYAFLRDNFAAALPVINTNSLNLGYQLGKIFLGYSHSIHNIGTKLSSNLFSLRWSGDVFNGFLAYKSTEDYFKAHHGLFSASAHLNLSEHWSLGYIYGLYPGSNSASLQLFL
ncbi:MAG: hypothetical protein ACXWR1_01255 [Bdellovibrionota bacterium]